jgi:drug/metabolite transporter (DMT)-like permease
MPNNYRHLLRAASTGGGAVAVARGDPLYLRGIVVVMLAGVFWSLAGILIRNVEAATDWQILFIRSSTLSLMLACVLAARHRSRTISEFRAIGWTGIVGGISLGMGFCGFVLALNHTTVANAVFILSASPFVTAPLAFLILGEQPRNATWIAMAAAAVGVAVMIAGGIRAGALFGNVMSLVAVLGFAGFAVALRRGRQTDMLPAVCLAGISSALGAATMVDSFAVSPRDFLLCATMGVVQLGVGLILFVNGSRHVPAAELALLSLTEVVLGPLIVWVGVGEVPGVLTLAGGAIVLSAIIGHALSGIRRKPPPIGAV